MKLILFGATGMVGQGVLRECLRDDGVEGILAVGRNSIGRPHPKLRESRRTDLFDFDAAGADLQGYDACFFCLGVSLAGMSETEYTRLTYGLTMGWAHALDADRLCHCSTTMAAGAGARTGGGRDQHRGAGPCDAPRRPVGCAQAGAGDSRSARTLGIMSVELMKGEQTG
jgi:nucleoside-diphosphate-sugar epimerase